LFKRLVSKILLLFFLALIISPTAIIVIDSSVDISMFYDVTEEKEEKVQEKNIEIESILDEIKGREFTFTLNSLQNNTDYFLKKYSKPYLIFTSPPPDLLNS
jgi:hypothetical protein